MAHVSLLLADDTLTITPTGHTALESFNMRFDPENKVHGLYKKADDEYTIIGFLERGNWRMERAKLLLHCTDGVIELCMPTGMRKRRCAGLELIEDIDDESDGDEREGELLPTIAPALDLLVECKRNFRVHAAAPVAMDARCKPHTAVKRVL